MPVFNMFITRVVYEQKGLSIDAANPDEIEEIIRDDPDQFHELDDWGVDTAEITTHGFEESWPSVTRAEYTVRHGQLTSTKRGVVRDVVEGLSGICLDTAEEREKLVEALLAVL